MDGQAVLCALGGGLPMSGVGALGGCDDRGSCGGGLGTLMIIEQDGSERLSHVASRPAGFHRQPLSEPSMKLSLHSAPIRQTCRACQSASARKGLHILVPVVVETGSREPCVP